MTFTHTNSIVFILPFSFVKQKYFIAKSAFVSDSTVVLPIRGLERG